MENSLKAKAEELFDDMMVDKTNPPSLKICKDIIKAYVNLGKDGSIGFKDQFFDLSDANRIGVYLVARKVMKILELIDDEKQRGSDIEKFLGLTEGTVSKRVGRELDNIIVNKKGYYLHNSRLSNFKKLLLGATNDS